MIFSRTKRQTLLLALAASMLGLYSCSEEGTEIKSTPAQIGNIKLDRDKIGSFQPFTAYTKVNWGINVMNEKATWIYNGTSYNAATDDEGTSVAQFMGMPAGTYDLTFKVEFNGYETKNDFTEKKTTVNVVACDVRNSFWNEKKDESLRNIYYYYLPEGVANENADKTMLQYKEKCTYGMEEKVEFGGERLATYIFDAKSKDYLQSIATSVELASAGKTEKAMADLNTHINNMKEYDDVTMVAYDYSITEGASLTDKEKELAENFKQGKIEDAADATLANALLVNKLTLHIEGKTEKTAIQIQASGDNEKIYFSCVYSQGK